MDQTVPLASSVNRAKGVYALLLGSGISSSAGIYTGWQIMLDLIRRAAVIHGQDCEPEPAHWYEKTYGKRPGYSDLVEIVAGTAADRKVLLQPYFEPTADERLLGKKVPTPAHRAIARLVRDGYIRVIVTTNFDQLMETALRDQMIPHTVVATPEAVKRMEPLAHTRCTVIKVHGDYLDPGLKNTAEELSLFDPPMNKLLDQVFDEYGLIVCGWSAEWDVALVDSLKRCSSHRYSTFWSVYDDPTSQALVLCTHRKALQINGKTADELFEGLEQKVTALAEFSDRLPASIPLALATLKRYLPDPLQRIPLEELVTSNLKSAMLAVAGHPGILAGADPKAISDFIKLCDERFAIAASLLLAGGRWGDDQKSIFWFRAVELVMRGSLWRGSSPQRTPMALYPAILTYYAYGVGATAGDKVDSLAMLLTSGRFTEEGGRRHRPNSLVPLSVNLLGLDNYCAFSYAADLGALKKESVGSIGFSPSVYSSLLNLAETSLGDTSRFDHDFCKFEYLSALEFRHRVTPSADSGERPSRTPWAPPGRYMLNPNAVAEVVADLKDSGTRRPYLKAGLFGDDLTRLEEIMSDAAEFTGNCRSEWGFW